MFIAKLSLVPMYGLEHTLHRAAVSVEPRSMGALSLLYGLLYEVLIYYSSLTSS